MRENVSIDVMRDLAKKEIWDMDKLKERSLILAIIYIFSSVFGYSAFSLHKSHFIISGINASMMM